MQKIQRLPRQCLRLATPLSKPTLPRPQQAKSVQDDVGEVEMVVQESKDEESVLDEVDNTPLLAENRTSGEEDEEVAIIPEAEQRDSVKGTSSTGKAFVKAVIDRLPGYASFRDSN